MESCEKSPPVIDVSLWYVVMRGSHTKEKLGGVFSALAAVYAIENQCLAADIRPVQGPCLGSVPGTKGVERAHPVAGRARSTVNCVEGLHGEADGHLAIGINSPNEFHWSVVVGEECAGLQSLRPEFLWCGPEEGDDVIVEIFQEVTAGVHR